MVRTQRHHHLPEQRRSRSAAVARQSVRPGHMLTWEFGESIDHCGRQPAADDDARTRAIFTSLDKALALAG